MSNQTKENMLSNVMLSEASIRLKQGIDQKMNRWGWWGWGVVE